MSSALIRLFVRTRFRLTSRAAASRVISRAADRYLGLAQQVDANAARRPVAVPSMLGVDPDMRHWSYWMLLEHNTIVNRAISAQTVALAEGTRLAGDFDPKRDVMPTETAGPEQAAAFAESVRDHLAAVAVLRPLRGTPTTPHPLFGDFDAHKWHCMLGFHLNVHMRQARLVAAASRG
jgi:hypothetical protein